MNLWFISGDDNKQHYDRGFSNQDDLAVQSFELRYAAMGCAELRATATQDHATLQVSWEIPS